MQDPPNWHQPPLVLWEVKLSSAFDRIMFVPFPIFDLLFAQLTRESQGTKHHTGSFEVSVGLNPFFECLLDVY